MKTAIALPLADFRIIEKIRHETGKSRSQILVEALHAWLEQRRQKQLDTQYADAYSKQPEKVSDIEATLPAGLAVWDQENW